jgi:hypothetical protein
VATKAKAKASGKRKRGATPPTANDGDETEDDIEALAASQALLEEEETTTRDKSRTEIDGLRSGRNICGCRPDDYNGSRPPASRVLSPRSQFRHDVAQSQTVHTQNECAEFEILFSI